MNKLWKKTHKYHQREWTLTIPGQEEFFVLIFWHNSSVKDYYLFIHRMKEGKEDMERLLIMTPYTTEEEAKSLSLEHIKEFLPNKVRNKLHG